ncbi:MAG: sugar phosphate isomerase/epimerase [Phycisphaeraceae bacterium]|nr:sugar phosphate isomerase/epimerase [Phycisphaeraceae bacterium]MBX3366038.1 sugar phosphate isomerase/epimerase [Phycisphaeraceae bacterium]
MAHSRQAVSRRDALVAIGGVGLAMVAPFGRALGVGRGGGALPISLAQWSLHRALFAKELDNLDFARTARESYGIEAVEYVNAFFFDKARDASYIGEMRKRADDEGVKSLLIMCDREGELAHSDEAKRKQSVENHRKWLEAAAALGCHSIRVNAAGDAPWDERMRHAADGLRALVDLAEPYGLNVIVENHGSLSSNGEWLAGVMKMVDHPRCGTLPDFGNFCLDWSRASDPEAWYDRYKGVSELMPYAKGVSAKSHEFDADGNEVRTNYRRMMKIVRDSGYTGYVGIEYEGDKHSEPDGIRLTKALLDLIATEK